MKVLFVCSGNKQRSPTAEDYFCSQYPQHEFDSAGTNHKFCEKAGTQKLEEEMLQWADLVLVMEKHHKQIIMDHTGGKYIDKIKVLRIMDVYRYGQRELVEILEEKVGDMLE